MAAEPVSSPPTLRSLLDELRASVRTERRLVTAEADAFDAFADRVESVAPGRPAATVAVRGVGQGGGRYASGGGLDEVRSAYERTVMSCDHYDDEYGDTYPESVAAEFGPEVGALLADGSELRPRLKRALLDRARTCRDDREHLLDMLDMEAASIDEVASECRSVSEELDEFAPRPDPDRAGSYGALEAEWRRLGVLGETLTDLSATRQRAIIAQRRRFRLPIDAPDIPVYLYQEFDDEYPLLSLFVRLRKRVRARRSERERGLARS